MTKYQIKIIDVGDSPLGEDYRFEASTTEGGVECHRHAATRDEALDELIAIIERSRERERLHLAHWALTKNPKSVEVVEYEYYPPAGAVHKSAPEFTFPPVAQGEQQ